MQNTTNENLAGLFPARIGRTSFLIRGTLLLCAGFLAGLLLSAADHASLATQIICIGGGVSMLLLLFVAMFRSLLMPRLRDIGLHPAWSLVFLVHALSGPCLLALLLVPANAFVAKQRYVM